MCCLLINCQCYSTLLFCTDSKWCDVCSHIKLHKRKNTNDTQSTICLNLFQLRAAPPFSVCNALVYSNSTLISSIFFCMYWATYWFYTWRSVYLSWWVLLSCVMSPVALEELCQVWGNDPDNVLWDSARTLRMFNRKHLLRTGREESKRIEWHYGKSSRISLLCCTWLS